MARYKAATKLYVSDKLINAGQEFESDLPPGKFWNPIDDEASAKVGDRPAIDRRGRVIPQSAAQKAVADAEKDRVAAGKRGPGRPAKRATPGLSVAEQHTRGEEPTQGHVHDGEDN